MAKAIRKEPVTHKLVKLIEDQGDLLKVQADRTDRLFKIIKGMEVTIKDQQEYIRQLKKLVESGSKLIHLIEKKPHFKNV